MQPGAGAALQAHLYPHGAAYEKLRTAGVGKDYRPRHVDTVNWMKLLGFRSPATIGEQATPEIIAFAALLAPMIGADPAELQKDVVNLLDVANFTPGQG